MKKRLSRIFGNGAKKKAPARPVGAAQAAVEPVEPQASPEGRSQADTGKQSDGRRHHDHDQPRVMLQAVVSPKWPSITI